MRREFAAAVLADQPEGLRSIAHDAPDPKVVRRLDELARMARAGEVRGIAYMLIERDERTGYGWIANRRLSYVEVLGMLFNTVLRYGADQYEP